MGDLDGCLCILFPNVSITCCFVGDEGLWDKGFLDLVTLELSVDYPDGVLVQICTPIGYSKRNSEMFFQNDHELLWYDTEQTIVQNGQFGW